MPSNIIPYGTLFNYSPRGRSERSVTSRNLCGAIKAGRPKVVEKAVAYLNRTEAENLRPFLNEDTTLVPVPRSAPLVADAIWPSKVIAEQLVQAGFGREVLPCIQRTNAIRKSSSQFNADSRPSVREQYDSLAVTPELASPTHITLIDDVLTLGRTTFACAQRLAEAYPNAEIRIFTLIRTQGFIPNVENIFDPSLGTISYNPNSGKTTRDP